MVIVVIIFYELYERPQLVLSFAFVWDFLRVGFDDRVFLETWFLVFHVKYVEGDVFGVVCC